MSFRVVRNSKFRHVFGQGLRKEQCYDNIRITKNSWDSNFCAVNPKFLAIVTEAAGGGAFLVISLKQTGKVDPNAPLVAGHKGAVLDIQWCPFDDQIIASASDDGIVRVWFIPEDGLTETLTEPSAELVGHQRRVGMVLWHPCAENILLSSGSDNRIIIWDITVAEPVTIIEHPDLAFHCAWNWDGSRLATTCKDKKIRIYDPRSGECEAEGEGHDGAKPQRVVYLKNDLVLTTGFSRMSERQYALRKATNLGDPIVLEVLDTSNGVLFPFYDPDVNLLYLCAKGDSSIRYFEITDKPTPYIHYISTYQSSEPQRGMGWMPKRGCDFLSCEIARFYKLHSKGLCEVLSFMVPRKSDTFQEDIYPETLAHYPAVTADEWIAGVNRLPVLMPVRDGYELKLWEAGKGLTIGQKKKALGTNLASRQPSHQAQKQAQSIQPQKDSKLAPAQNDRETGSLRENSNGNSLSSCISKNRTSAADGDVTHSLISRATEDLTSVQRANEDLNNKVTELSNELHKMKAIVLKHEVRIRDLEKIQCISKVDVPELKFE